MVPNGFGELLKGKDGAVIKGMWEQGDIKKGMEIMKDGEVYTGPFINLKRHGMGECTFPDKKMKYQGQWECGEIKGEGTYVNQKDGTRMNGSKSKVDMAAKSKGSSKN